MQRHIFGPVPSRRLGRSLGVDLVPLKTCPYDCVYCQLGRTTCKTLDRKTWVSLDRVLGELETALTSRPDYVTLSGSGEPTLFTPLDELIGRIKAMTDVPVAVLTNGSLLWREDVRRELAEADLLVPSLDAGDQPTFEAVNRPHEDVVFETMLEGLIACRREFPGPFWLEVLLLDDLTADGPALDRLIECVGRIGPDRVQLNTATRPPAERTARPVSLKRLEAAAARFDPPAEVIADFEGAHQTTAAVAGRDEVLVLLRRRPCGIDDLAAGLGMHPNEVVKHVEQLLREQRIRATWSQGKRYYQAVAES